MFVGKVIFWKTDLHRAQAIQNAVLYFVNTLYAICIKCLTPLISMRKVKEPRVAALYLIQRKIITQIMCQLHSLNMVYNPVIFWMPCISSVWKHGLVFQPLMSVVKGGLNGVFVLCSIESTRKGAFGSTSQRIAPMMRRQEEQMPGIWTCN